MYNAQFGRECHQTPVSGGSSQITELRVGLLDRRGRFQKARIPIARGTAVIAGRSLVNDRAICPNKDLRKFKDLSRSDRQTIEEFLRSL